MPKKEKLVRTALLILFSLWLLFTIIPLLWTIITSLKSPSEVASLPPKLLFRPDFSNYQTLLFGGKGGFYTIEQEGFWKYFINSLVVSILTTVLTLFLGTTSSYYLARGKMLGERLSIWILSFRMMPPIAVVIPFYMMLTFIGLVDSKFSLVLVYTIFNLPLTIWLVSAYINTIPKAYDEMGFVDGFSKWSVFKKIILPLSRPAILTAGLLVFIFSWNEFLFALVLTGFKSKTLPVLATGFITQRGIIWGQLTATAVIMTIPIILITILMQKYFVKGLSLGLKKM